MNSRAQQLDPGGGALRRAKALSAPRRVEILGHLREAGPPLTAGDLAMAVGIHHTAVRRHLALLAAADMVRSLPLPVQGRGRPRTGYIAVEGGEAEPYRELAAVLAEAVHTGNSARAAGREAGERVKPSPNGPIATMCHEAERLGFQPRLQHKGAVHEIEFQACPFAYLASVYPDTVCALHVGLSEGIAIRAGSVKVDAIRLADPHKGGCRMAVRATAT